MEGYDATVLLKMLTTNTKHDPAYQPAFEKYTHLKRKVYSANLDREEEFGHAKETDTILHAKIKKHSVEINKPTYLDLKRVRVHLDNQLDAIMDEYALEKHNTIRGKSASKLIKLTERINSIHGALRALSDVRTQSVNTRTAANLAEHAKNETAQSEIAALFDRITAGARSDMDTNALLEEYFKAKQESDAFRMSESYQRVASSTVRGSNNDIHFMVEPVEELLISCGNPSERDQPKSPTTDPTIEKLEKTIKKKIQKKVAKLKTPEKTEEIVNDDKILTQWLFKDPDECTSQKRTKPFYMSKEAILKMIESDPVLKKKFGPNVKKLSKNQICEQIF